MYQFIKKERLLYIDSHFHMLCLEEKGMDTAAILSEMDKLGMEGIDIGTVCDDLEKRKGILRGHTNYALSAGIGPWAVGQSTEVMKQQILLHGPVCAIGEIGLDNHWKDYAPKKEQEALFLEQIELANELALPIIIHCREADEQLLTILKSVPFKKQGILHCFEGSPTLCARALDKGFYISFSGVITYKGSEKLRDIAKQVPFSQLLLETDSPYLAPIPQRGKRNTPLYIPYTYETMGNIKGVSASELQAQLLLNLHAFLSQGQNA